MAVLLGVLVAVTYGSGDFLGGVASRRSDTAAVTVGSQLVGLLSLALLIAITGWAQPHRVDTALGVTAGLAGAFGLLLLYRGLATGRMSVVAPITAVTAALLPLLWGIGAGERPGAIALTGAGLALTAIVLISRVPDPVTSRRADPRAVPLSLAAGVGFGILFIALGQTTPDSGAWPLLVGRVASVTAVAGWAVLRGRALLPRRGDRPAAAGAGLLDTMANVLFLLAVRQGLLSLVAVLASLYPAATVALARVVLKERITPPQGAGLLLAGAGVAMIAAR